MLMLSRSDLYTDGLPAAEPFGPFVDFVLEHAGHRIVDVGCGTGMASPPGPPESPDRQNFKERLQPAEDRDTLAHGEAALFPVWRSSMPLFRAGAAGAALALSALAVFSTVAPAAADHVCPNPDGHYPPGQCVVGADVAGGVSDTTPVPGGQASVRSEGHKPSSEARVFVESTPILVGTFVADSAGVVTGTFTVPPNLSVGAHSVVVRGVAPSGLPLVNRFPITITAANAAIAQGATPGTAEPGASVAGVQLPRTGGEITAVTAIGVGLVAAGGAAVYAGRRRRTEGALAG